MSDAEEPKGLEFPCEYPVKAMGPNTDDFEQSIMDLVKQHAPEVSTNSVHSKTSSTGKFRSVTVLVYAHSKDHLVGIYQDLKDHPDVSWTL